MCLLGGGGGVRLRGVGGVEVGGAVSIIYQATPSNTAVGWLLCPCALGCSLS